MMSTTEFKCSMIETVKLNSDVNTSNFNIFNSLAVGTSDKSVFVWNWTGEGYKEAPYSPLKCHDYAVISVVFSPDGLILASSSTDGITYVFNSKTGVVKGTIVQSIGGGVRESAISPSTQRLLATVTDDGYIFLWDYNTCQIQRYWLGHEVCVSCLAFSPDCFLLGTGDTDGTFKLWLVDHAVSHLHTVDSLCSHVQKDAHDGGILTITFSPNHFTELVTRDYQMCSGGDDNLVRLWHVCVEPNTGKGHKIPQVTLKLLKVFKGHLSSVTCVRYSPDGQFIGSTSLDSSARLWQVSTGVCIRALGGHKHSVFCCAFSSEIGFFASGSNDKTVNVWKLSDSPLPLPVHQANSNTEPEEFSKEQSIEGRHFNVKKVLKMDGNINSIDFNNNCDIVVGSSDKLVRAFSVMEPELQEFGWSPLKSHGYSVVNVEFSRCGHYLVTGSIDGTVIVWNYLNGKMVNKPFQLSSQGGRAARFSPSSDCLGLGYSDGKVYLWSITSESIIFSYPGHIESVNCMAFSPDGEYLATGCAAGQLKLWKASPACSICQVLLENVHDLGIMSCDFSSCYIRKKGTVTRMYHLATGGNDSLIKVFKLWPIDELIVKAVELFCLRGHGGSITEVRFSSKTSNVLASTAIDRTARIWNVQNGQCLNVLSQHKSQVTCCAFSADSILFATGSLDSSIIIWNVSKDISLYNKYGNSEQSSTHKLNGGGSLDLNALSIDDVHVSLEDLITVLKRNSTEIPDHMLCPITQQVMMEPVICEDGFTYENHAIQAWMVDGRRTSPMTNVPLSSTIVVPNTALQVEIKKFLLAHYKTDKM